MSVIVDNDVQVDLSAADIQFVNRLTNRLTSFGRLPFKPDKRMIVQVMIESARFFYRYYHGSTTRKFFRLTKESVANFWDSEQPNTRMGRWVKMPSNINVVQEIYQVDKNNPATSQELINNIQLLQRSAPYGQSILGINNSLYIMEAAAKMVEETNFQSIYGTPVAFKYSRLEKVLQLFEEPSYDMVLETLANVDIQYLYNDDLYFRHVLAVMKSEERRVPGAFTADLPGNVQLNIEQVFNNIEDQEKVEDMIKNSSGIGDIIMFRHE
jgi:hypothetical protein